MTQTRTTARTFLLGVVAMIFLTAVTAYGILSAPQESNSNAARKDKAALLKNVKNAKTAVFAGGCFWCMEPPFEKLEGVIAAESGYTGGHDTNPTYEKVNTGRTGHVEAIRVTYDADKLSYNDLLEVFWRSFDPTDAGGQFYDRGYTYTSAIFVANDSERALAEASKKRLEKSGRFKKKIVTPIRTVSKFYLAEEYHQDYYLTHTRDYKRYRKASGRDRFINKHWGRDRYYKPVGPKKKKARYEKPSDSELRKN